MKIEEVRSIAKAHGINPAKLPKAELIKSIQAGEGRAKRKLQMSQII